MKMVKVYFCLILALTHAQLLAVSPNVKRTKRDDDLSVNALHAIVQQQAQAIQTLQAEVQVLKNRMRAVAFSVRFSAGASISTHSIFRFDDIVTNIGNGYDSSTGKFTAPISGVYVFFLEMMSSNDPQSDYIRAAITKNDTVLDMVWGAGGADPDDQGSTLITTHVAAGEEVYVSHESGTPSLQESWYTVFSGYLLQAD